MIANLQANGHAKRLVDQFGAPIPRVRPRFDLQQLQPKKSREVQARYDAAQTTDNNQNYWSAADSYDADSANAREVREILVPRSRYEVFNNGFADGIAQTFATDLVGSGPTLRMQSGSTGFNQMVEAAWRRWAKAVHLRRKLWCMAHAKYVDGEAIGIVRRNPNLMFPVQLEVVLYETEQCQTPFLDPGIVGKIDGISFDQFGNPETYDILRQHPGNISIGDWNMVPERVPANLVAHWYKLRRPGQHRGVPESQSTLNCGAAARRWREAVLAAAEAAADFAVLLQTQLQPDELDPVTPFSTQAMQNGAMVALPWGWSAAQMKAEHPNATHDSFMRAHVSEMARPKSMPKNKATCDSSDYNYASGRLDHQTYYAGLDVERADCNDMVLDVLFEIWWTVAVARYGWLGGNPAIINPVTREHSWDWPQYPVADEEAEAKAQDIRLRNGSLSLNRLYAMKGLDFEDEVAQMAETYGFDVDDMRKVIMSAIFARLSATATFPLDPTGVDQVMQEGIGNADTATT